MKISSRPPSTDNLRICQTGEGNSFYPPLHGIILAISENAKNGRKKTGNLFLISCLGVPFYIAAVIQFLCNFSSANCKYIFLDFI